MRISGLDLSFTGGGGGGVAFLLHHGGLFALKGCAPSRVYYLAGTEELPPQPDAVILVKDNLNFIFNRI